MIFSRQANIDLPQRQENFSQSRHPPPINAAGALF